MVGNTNAITITGRLDKSGRNRKGNWYARIKAIHDEQSFQSLCLLTVSLIGSFWS